MIRLLLLLALGLTACTSAEPPPVDEARTEVPLASDAPTTALAISDAYAMPAPLGGTGVLFFTIDGGPTPDTLVSVSYDGAAKTDLHESISEADGTSGMRALAGIPVTAGAQVRLGPGGYHTMLVELTRPLAAGDTLAATAAFASGTTLPVRAVVRSLDALPTPTP